MTSGLTYNFISVSYVFCLARCMWGFVQHGVSEEAIYQGNLEHAQNLPEVVYEVITPLKPSSQRPVISLSK